MSQALATVLSRRHGGKSSSWRRRLRAAGIRPEASEANLSGDERRALRGLLSPPTTATLPEPPDFDAVAWTRAATLATLRRWEPWRLASGDVTAAYAEHRRRLIADVALGTEELGTEGGALPSPPTELPPDLAPWIDAAVWRGADPQARRVLTVLIALERSPLLARIVATLAGLAPAPGFSARIVRRVAAAGGRRLARDAGSSAAIEELRVGDIDLWRLADPARESGTPAARPTPDRSAPAELDVRGLLRRVPRLPEDAAPLVFGDDTRAAIDQIAIRWRHRDAVRVPGDHRGVTCLFVGPPGHGKRSAASRLAERLGLDLFEVSSGRLASRYIGETEARISAVFDHLSERDAAVLIDAAQDLVGARTRVDSSNDRYANMAVNHLLTTIERWPGLCIMTAPAISGFDAAMQRRIDVSVRFEPAGDGWRREVVDGVWGWLAPRLTPVCTEGVEPHVFDGLAAQDALSPAQITRLLVDAAVDAHIASVPLDGDALDARVERTLAALGHAVRRHW